MDGDKLGELIKRVITKAHESGNLEIEREVVDSDLDLTHNRFKIYCDGELQSTFKLSNGDVRALSLTDILNEIEYAKKN